MHLPVPAEAEGVVSLPGGTDWGVVVATAFAESTVLMKYGFLLENKKRK